MATTTTNFGWDIPQSTDLVKDGATAIAALGQDIDTAFVDFKGGTTGQVLKKTSGTDLDVEWGTPSSGLTLINTTSFSGVTTQSVNSVFSSTYDNYHIQVYLSSGPASGNLTLKLRASGTDTSTGYEYQEIVGASTTVSGAADDAGNNQWLLTRLSSADTCHFEGSIMRPNLAEKTLYHGFLFYSTSSFGIIGGYQTAVTQFDGFTLIGPSAMTGTIRLYGYAK